MENFKKKIKDYFLKFNKKEFVQKILANIIGDIILIILAIIVAYYVKIHIM